MTSVIRALMSVGTMKTALQPLTDEEVELVTTLIRTRPDDFSGPPTFRKPPRPPRGGPSSGPDESGVREPRGPRPRPSAGAAALPEDDLPSP
jgi:hypothetical protein